MKHFAKLLLSVLVIAGVSLGYGDSARRAQKIMEEGGKILADAPPPVMIEGQTSGWLPQTVDPASVTYGGAQYLAPGTVFLSGYTASADYLYRSYNNGGSWTKLAPPTSNAGFVFAARDSNLVLAGTFAGTMLRSTDGGATWDTTYQHVDYIDGIVFVGSNVAIAVGDYDSAGVLLIRSTDAGLTWSRIKLAPEDSAMYYSYATYRQAMAVYNNTVWVTLYRSGQNARIMKSTDAGVTWDSWAVPLTGGTAQNYYLRSINFIDDSIGFAVDRQVASGLDNYLHRSTDGGRTWSDTLNLGAGPHANFRVRSAKGIPGTDKVLVVGWGSATTTAKMWISEDKGLTFNPVTVTGSALQNSAALDSNKIYAVGLNSTVLKYTPKNVRKVVLTVNTATVPDTLPVTGSKIQIRGSVNHAGGFSPITWGNDAQNDMTNVGGDYWQKTLYMQAGDTLRYKFVVAYATGTGWESGVVPADYPAATGADRSFVVPDNDTTAMVQFWNNGAGTRSQYFRPYPAAADSYFTVYFRVNMNGIISQGSYGYNGDVDTLAVRGGGSAGSDLDWGRSFFLTKETAASGGDGYTSPPGSFWSGGLKIKKAGLTEGQTIGFKFLIGSNWNRPAGRADEETDRNFKVPVGFKDTTLKWVYFNNSVPTARANPDTVRMTFVANLAQAAASGGFNVTTDTLYVRTGYFSTANESGRGKRMIRLSGTIFQVTDTIVTAKKKLLDYQYYVLRNAVEQRESYYNFLYNGPVQSEAERRQVLVDSTASLTTTQTVRDTATSITQARRQPVFPNGRKLARNVNVKWEVDLRPAYYQVHLGGDSLTDIQGPFTIRVADKDSIMKWGVWINGDAVGGWTNWGLDLQNNLAKKMYDNGTNGDRVAGDSIFTRQVLASPDSVNIGNKDRVGQVFKFGIRGGDNEGGKGGFGNNHNENILDADSVYTLFSQFGSINPAFYDAWNYDLRQPQFPTSVIDPTKPLVYELLQNYPNPFNPTTKIEYSIPLQSQVELKIYNVVGQEVGTLVNEIQKAGVHTVKLDAGNLASGVYFYRLVAGNFTSVKKMVLLK